MHILKNMFGAVIRKWAGLCFLVCLFAFGSSTSALGSLPVISHVKTGETGAASKEFVAIYNSSDQSLDVTGWCIYYSSASDATKTKLACLDSGSESVSLTLLPFGYARFSTVEFNAAADGFIPDALFSAGLSATSGHIRLLDEAKNEIDKVGWGAAVAPEQVTVPAPESGFVLLRKVIDGTNYRQDTDNNQQDFSSSQLTEIPASGIVEQEIVKDVCTNIEDLQTAIPDDYFLNSSGDCAQDQCDNLDGLQEMVPSGYESPDGENCSVISIPLESSILQITELLPNAGSTDTGKEYIEIYNPNDRSVDLKDYRLELGPAYTKTHTFTQQILNPFSYTSFSDLLTQLTLPNTSASVRLIAPNGDVVSQTDTYSDPDDDESWSLIDDIWQYSSVLTPDLPNLPSPVASGTTSEPKSSLPDCGPGKYRNPDTNRCKSLTAGDQELTPCQAGQTRNPATNRCRSAAAAASSLVPCKSGQERNPATNRCRSIVSTASALVPCKEGQERNPDTNRCRKSATLGASTLANVQDVPSATAAKATNWPVIGGVAVLAVGYGAYEWRAELLRLLAKVKIK